MLWKGSREDKLSCSSRASAVQKAFPRHPRAAHNTKCDVTAAETVKQLIFEASLSATALQIDGIEK